jgi:hypothetical protein
LFKGHRTDGYRSLLERFDLEAAADKLAYVYREGCVAGWIWP